MRKRLVWSVAGLGALALGGALFGPAAQALPSTEQAPIVAAGEGQAGPIPTPPKIKWTACGIPGFDELGARCGYLVVPLDYSRKNGSKIRLAVSRIAHTVPSSKYQGVMLTNPGGPGGSGLTLSVLGQYVPNKVGAAYDWIGFDPRGVGSSLPSLACDSKYFGYNRPPYNPSTPAIESAWLHKSRNYATRCDKAGGALLDHVKTIDTVRDMESLRLALGRSQINYYGFSYGTYLGQVYATNFPTRVRRMVLDGNVDARKVWYQANLDQDVAFDKNIKTYFAWIAKYDSVYHLGTTEDVVEKKYYDTLATLTSTPAVGGTIGPDEWNDTFVSAAYYIFEWEDIAKIFAAAINEGNFQPVKDYFDAGFPTDVGSDNGYAMYLATQCTEGPWPKEWSTWRADNDRLAATSPFLTWSNAWYNAPCRYWGAKSQAAPRVSGTKAPAILLISETNDAATPFTGSLYARRLFPKSRLIEGVGGTTHAGSLNGVACVDNWVAAYLGSGRLPARLTGNTSDKKCPPLPQPDPTAAATGRVKSSSAATITRADLQKLIGTR